MWCRLFSVFMFLVSTNVTAEIISAWNLIGNTGNEPFEAAASSADHVTGNHLVRGAGLNAVVGAGSLNASGWSLGGVDDYFSFGFTVDNGYEVDLDDLTIALRASNTGPGLLGLFYSGDSFTSTLFTFAQSGDSMNNQMINLSGLQGLTGNIEFRIRAISNTQADGIGTISNGGTLRIAGYYDGHTYTNVQFQGSVSAVPEPQVHVMLMAGLALLGLVSRRQG